MAQRDDRQDRMLALNALDRLIGWFSPAAALRRVQARTVLAYYEAAKPSRLRKFYRDRSSPNQLVSKSAVALRDQARHLQRNHDLARGALRTMVNNFVGANGIAVEFQPRRADGSIHKDYAYALAQAFREWKRRPEVTRQHSWAQVQRLVASTWIRDGEAFAHELIGPVPYLTHTSRVPYSLELLEPDLIPMDYDQGARIRQGIEINAWGQPVAYHVYKQHPGENVRFVRGEDLKRVPADRMIKVSRVDRIGQLRGISEFASVITRLEDIKDYEESERVAAKVAAMLTAYVKRQAPDGGGYMAPETDEQGNPRPRELSMAPGMIIDTLAVGEDIGLIDSKRPNPNLITFRQGQLRAFAAGFGISYSSASRDYNGTYSAQRQELVEQWVNYAVLTDDFVSLFVQPVLERWVLLAHMSGAVPRPADVVPGTEHDFLFIGQSMPWIDPVKEATAWVTLVRAGFASEVEVARRRGISPWELLEQISGFRDEARSKGLVFDSDAASGQGAAARRSDDEEGQQR